MNLLVGPECGKAMLAMTPDNILLGVAFKEN
jgi:hypothetical protein